MYIIFSVWRTNHDVMTLQCCFHSLQMRRRDSIAISRCIWRFGFELGERNSFLLLVRQLGTTVVNIRTIRDPFNYPVLVHFVECVIELLVEAFNVLCRECGCWWLLGAAVITTALPAATAVLTVKGTCSNSDVSSISWIYKLSGS